LKEALKGQYFISDAEVKVAVHNRIKSEIFFINGMKKWIKNLEIYVTLNSDYVLKNKFVILERNKFILF